MMKWIERIIGERGVLTHGGSVSTNAYDFAKRLGASPVIMVGQDLAFSGGYAHARGSYLDEQIHLRRTRFVNAEMHNRFQLTALPKIMVKGIADEKVHTNQKMMIFLSWFEKRKDDTLINATPEGAYLPGILHKATESLSFDKQLKAVSAMVDDCMSSLQVDTEVKDKKSRLLKRLDLMLKEIDTLIPSLEKAIGFSDNLMELFNKNKNDKSKLNYLLQKLSQTDKLVESQKNIKDFISFSVQRVIHTITEGYEIDEKDKNLSEEELVAKRSQYLYRGLLDGAEFNKKLFGKMIMLLKS